jgi:hypothetical protein
MDLVIILSLSTAQNMVNNPFLGLAKLFQSQAYRNRINQRLPDGTALTITPIASRLMREWLINPASPQFNEKNLRFRP